MELVIPGLILVALMVYTSTKIKKNAARAYENESIETEEFSITKPNGFLHPLNDDSDYLFEAYTKEFGEDHAGQCRQASAEVLVFDYANFDEQRDEICREALSVIFEKTDEDGRGKTLIMEVELEEKGIFLNSFFKVIARHNKIYRLRISVIAEYKAVYLDRINEMLESFEIK